MKRPKFQLVKTNCRRCGVELYTGNRSLWGADEARRKYAGICHECLTTEEHDQMQKEISEAVYASVRGAHQ